MNALFTSPKLHLESDHVAGSVIGFLTWDSACWLSVHPDLYYYNSNNECAYYLEDDFKLEFGKAKEIHGLSIIHLNCRSLVKHFDDLKDFLININSNTKFDVIALSKTWLMPNKHDLSDFVLDRYTLHPLSRNSKIGGYVAIYVNDDFNQKVNVIMLKLSKIVWKLLL